jgi:peptide/nickel transport system ATP-binding protein
MRVGDIVREPLKIHGIGKPGQQRETVRRLLGEVGLSEGVAARFPHELSGGQRQRIALARALALDPAVLVADEPVSALDVSVQAQILNLLRDLTVRHRLTLVMISHDLAVVRYVADTIGVMYLGKLVELGPAEAVYRLPAHPYTASLLAAVPRLDASGSACRPAALSGELPSAADPPSGCRFRTRCPRAAEVCAALEPPLQTFGVGHVGACHLPLRPPDGPAPPG